MAPSVEVGAGTELLPGVILRGDTRIGEGCTIGPNCLLSNAVIGKNTTVNSSQIYDSAVGEGCSVGPFSYIRPGCRIGDGARVGDFVEVKNSSIGDGTKVAHLTYVGDATWATVNFGCGTVTVNYDRAKKHRTVIEDDAFIGATPTWWRPSPWAGAPTSPPAPPSPRTSRPRRSALPGHVKITRRNGQPDINSKIKNRRGKQK